MHTHVHACMHTYYRAVAIRFGVVRFLASACVSTLQLGGVGHAPQEKCLEFRGYEIASDTMLLGGQTTEFHMYEYLPFLPIVSYSTGFGFPIVRLPHKLHPS